MKVKGGNASSATGYSLFSMTCVDIFMESMATKTDPGNVDQFQVSGRP